MVPPSPYIVRILIAMVNVCPILAAPIPIPYTTFTWWVPGAAISALKRVSYPFRSQRSLTCVFSKVNMYFAFFFVFMVLSCSLLLQPPPLVLEESPHSVFLGIMVKYVVIWLMFLYLQL